MKRICAILLVLSLSVAGFQPLQVGAQVAVTQENELEVSIRKVLSEQDFQECYVEADSIDVIHLNKDTLQEIQLDDVKEVIDNGTDLLVNNADLVEIEELLDVNSSVGEEDNNSTAVYITTDNSEYQTFPVYASVVYDEEAEVENEKIQADALALYEYLTTEEALQTQRTTFNLEEKETITPEEVYKLIHERSNEDILEQITEEELASLQTSTLIGNSFCENSKIVYFYKEGSANGTGTEYDYSTSTSKTGWSKMGSLSMAVYGLKVKTIGDATYDNVYSVVTASGLNDKHVTQFGVNVYVSELTANSIIDETTSTGGSSATTGKLATEVSSTGSVTASGMTTYAYNSGATCVSTSFGDKYSKGWTFTPSTAKENASWKVRPGILLKKTNGTTSAVTAGVSVDYFQVSGGVRYYTIKDTVKCSIKFKNHKEV